MEKIYRVFTINRGTQDGAYVERHKLANGTMIPVIRVGEEGRGRRLGLINIALNNDSLNKFNEGTNFKVYAVTLGTTKTGKPKFFEADVSNACEDEAILVMPTHIGFRGNNRHTGDRIDLAVEGEFKPFPGEVLAEGVIAEGAAGRAGAGYQYIAKVPKGEVFRTAYGGRMYGRPSNHYYLFTGTEVLCQTWSDREASDFMIF